MSRIHLKSTIRVRNRQLVRPAGASGEQGVAVATVRSGMLLSSLGRLQQKEYF